MVSRQTVCGKIKGSFEKTTAQKPSLKGELSGRCRRGWGQKCRTRQFQSGLKGRVRTRCWMPSWSNGWLQPLPPDPEPGWGRVGQKVGQGVVSRGCWAGRTLWARWVMRLRQQEFPAELKTCMWGQGQKGVRWAILQCFPWYPNQCKSGFHFSCVLGLWLFFFFSCSLWAFLTVLKCFACTLYILVLWCWSSGKKAQKNCPACTKSSDDLTYLSFKNPHKPAKFLWLNRRRNCFVGVCSLLLLLSVSMPCTLVFWGKRTKSYFLLPALLCLQCCLFSHHWRMVLLGLFACEQASPSLSTDTSFLLFTLLRMAYKYHRLVCFTLNISALKHSPSCNVTTPSQAERTRKPLCERQE